MENGDQSVTQQPPAATTTTRTQQPATPEPSKNQHTKTGFDTLPSPTTELQDGTLLKVVHDTINDIQTDLQYDIGVMGNGRLEHRIELNSNLQFAIRDFKDSFAACHPAEISIINDKTERTDLYSTFATAFAAVLGGLNWGTLPIERPPKIWEYRGYDCKTESFAEYINGNNNDECGDHYLINNCADYCISIKSHTDQRPGSNPHATIAILTIHAGTEFNDEKLLYRERFRGQKQAFTRLVNLAHSNLSKNIQQHYGTQGDPSNIHTVQHLTSEP